MPGFEKSCEQLPCPTCPNEGSMLSDLRTWTLLLEICTQRGGCVRAACAGSELGAGSVLWPGHGVTVTETALATDSKGLSPAWQGKMENPFQGVLQNKNST